MKKKCLLAAAIVLAVNNLYSQYQAANWPLIYNNLVVKITPDSFVLQAIPDYATGFIANTSVSDSQGNLLFFSFGNDAKNKEGAIMDNGATLCEDTVDTTQCSGYYVASGNPYEQGALILPRPGSSTQYYLFIKDGETYAEPTRITASLIDMSYNNGVGKVLQRAVPILNAVLSNSRMTACQHGNGRDWWLINHQYNSNTIYTHLITPDTIEGPFEQNIGLSGSEADAGGTSIFSPVSKVFATSTGGMGAIMLLDFDRCSGIFSNLKTVNTVNSDTGNYCFLAFSPNGRFLYAGNVNGWGSNNGSFIEQYDLQDSDIAASRVQLIHDTATYPLMGPMVLMPDGKIYIAGWTIADSLLSVIDSPNLKFPACAFHLRSVVVPNSVLIANVPNFPNYNLGALKGSGCDTIADIRQETLGIRPMRVQPNPANDYTTVYYNIADWSKGAVYLELCNTLGQTVYTQPLPMYSGLQKIDVSNLASGMYMVFIKRSGAVIATNKLVKQ